MENDSILKLNNSSELFKYPGRTSTVKKWRNNHWIFYGDHIAYFWFLFILIEPLDEPWVLQISKLQGRITLVQMKREMGFRTMMHFSAEGSQEVHHKEGCWNFP